MTRAHDHALALRARLSTVRMRQRVAVVVGEVSTAVAHEALRDGDIDGFVAFVDTVSGVIVQRHTDDERLALLIDRAVEVAAMDVGSRAIELDGRGSS